MKRSTKHCHCGKRSLPGLRPGIALCQYHFDVRMYGKEWADRCEEERTNSNVAKRGEGEK